MAQGIDFLLLYREFQLKPGAGIDDLKRAYRRRVSIVHPDRLDSRDAISQQLANEHLQRLTTLYEAGIQFHRQHGRLPGASAAAEVQTEAHRTERDSSPVRQVRTASHRLRWIMGTLFLIGGFAWWLWPAESGEEPVASQTTPVARVLALGEKVPTALEAKDGILPGMYKDAVLRIQGAPVLEEGERWLYGPSWILFHEGKVTEWYSSPLHPLKISSKTGE